jgi:hypothetical protein
MHRSATIGLALAVMLASGYALFAASAWPWKAALFPLAIGIPLFCLATTELLWAFLGSDEKRAAPDPGAQRRVAIVAGWMLAFFAAIVLLGFLAAVPLFLFLYLKVQAREGWATSVGLTAAVFAAFYGLFDALLHLPFPRGLLF